MLEKNEEKYIRIDSVGVTRYHYSNDTIEINFSSLEENIIFEKIFTKGPLYQETKTVFDIMVNEWFDRFEINLPNMVHDTEIITHLLYVFNRFSVQTSCNYVNDCQSNFRLYLGNYIGKFSYNPKHKKWKFETDEMRLFNVMSKYISIDAIKYWYYVGESDYKLKPLEIWFLGMFSFQQIQAMIHLHEDEKKNPDVLHLYHQVMSDPVLKFAVDFDFIEYMK